MKITLQLATETDAQAIHDLQIEAFTPLVEKYRDYNTSPATEPLEKTVRRLRHPAGHYYMILADGELAGAINIFRKEIKGSLWISPIFIAPSFQGRGIGQQAMQMAEQKFSNDRTWELSTLAEETGNCYLYEKLGYKRTDRTEKINERTTLVYYKKELE